MTLGCVHVLSPLGRMEFPCISSSYQGGDLFNLIDSFIRSFIHSFIHFYLSRHGSPRQSMKTAFQGTVATVVWPGEGMGGQLPSYFLEIGKNWQKWRLKNAVKMSGYTFLPPNLKFFLSFTLHLILPGHAVGWQNRFMLQPLDSSLKGG